MHIYTLLNATLKIVCAHGTDNLCWLYGRNTAPQIMGWWTELPLHVLLLPPHPTQSCSLLKGKTAPFIPVVNGCCTLRKELIPSPHSAECDILLKTSPSSLQGCLPLPVGWRRNCAISLARRWQKADVDLSAAVSHWAAWEAFFEKPGCNFEELLVAPAAACCEQRWLLCPSCCQVFWCWLQAVITIFLLLLQPFFCLAPAVVSN